MASRLTDDPVTPKNRGTSAPGEMSGSKQLVG